MSNKIPDAGELSQKIRVLACVPEDESRRRWCWREVRKAWADAQFTNGLALFSNSGVAGREVTFIIRRQRVSLRGAILWRERFCLPTSIAELGAGHLTVKAAVVPLRQCVSGLEGPEEERVYFPGVLAEKYTGHRQLEPMAQNLLRLVLVTPKDITLAPGSLVEVGDPAPYEVQAVHELDPDKNEYEIVRMVEP